MAVQFEDYRIQVKAKMNDCVSQFLEEAASEVESQTKRNQTRVDTGQTKGGWTHVVDESKREAVVGNPLENAIWEELGTGEFALEGNGRKGGWFYVDAKGEGHFTRGKTPLRALHNAFESCKAMIKRRAEEIMKGLN